MASRVRQAIVRHRVRPRILLSLENSGGMIEAIVEMAHEWKWDLLDYSLLCETWPNDLPLRGALVDMLPSDPLVMRLRELGCPTVRLGQTYHPLDMLLPAVLPDMHAAGQLAATHFLERGFQHLAFVGWQPENPASDFHDLFMAYKRTAEKAGVVLSLYNLQKFHQANEVPAVRFQRLQRELGHWLGMLPKPVGIMAYNDLVAARLCVIFQQFGGHVPEEIALLGYGNSSWCERSPVALSSIATGYGERARRGMQLLRSLMEGAEPPSKPILVPPSGLVKRRSSDILAMSDLLVAKGLMFIWEHIRENIAVKDVADAVGMSERQLGRRFRAAIGRSVNQEIARRRLEEVKRLLRAGDLSIAQIAEQTGYRSARYLHYVFQRAEGITPATYRETSD
ncbi:MAG: substrate-binding domain-containing protein [Kiritimatiellia bacterium]